VRVVTLARDDKHREEKFADSATLPVYGVHNETEGVLQCGKRLSSRKCVSIAASPSLQRTIPAKACRTAGVPTSSVTSITTLMKKTKLGADCEERPSGQNGVQPLTGI